LKRKNLNENIEQLYKKLNEKTKFRFKTSDHCILRYLQRVQLVPVSEARYKILSLVENYFVQNEDVYEKIKNSDIELRIQDKVFIISKNKTIKTIIID
jgi:hypothetical protein